MSGVSDEWPNANGSATFELIDIVAGYGSTVVLKDVTLRIRPGAAVALTGPNGAGKSTLLRVASGHHAVRAGEVLLNGRRMSRMRADERSRSGICLIPEGRCVFPSLTVRENLLLQVHPREKKRDLTPAIDMFPFLKTRLRQKAGTMSGGEQRIVALGRCFLSSPKVVLLDELSSGLAPRVLDTLAPALASLVQQGVGLLVAEPYATSIITQADEHYTLADGQLRVADADTGSGRHQV